jgi:hypothetical protein
MLAAVEEGFRSMEQGSMRSLEEARGDGKAMRYQVEITPQAEG